MRGFRIVGSSSRRVLIFVHRVCGSQSLLRVRMREAHTLLLTLIARCMTPPVHALTQLDAACKSMSAQLIVPFRR